MLLKNKLFRISTLSIIVTIAVVFCCITEGVFGTKYEETGNISNQTEAKSKIDEKSLTKDKEVVKNYDEKVSEAVLATPAPPAEVTQASLMGFTPIPGVEVPGIDYRQYIDYNNYNGVAIISTNNYVNIRKGPGENHEVIGKIRPNGGCFIIENATDNVGASWTKIYSNNVEGYVRTEYLTTGTEALALVSSVGRMVATSKHDALNIRLQPSLDAQVVAQISLHEELDVASVNGEWIQVRLDMAVSDDGNSIGYVNANYVSLQFKLHTAFKYTTYMVDNNTNTNNGGSSNNAGQGVTIDPNSMSQARVQMIEFAQKYIGYNYLMGGTTLTKEPGKGIDCSAFMQKIYAQIGVTIPRNSAAQAGCGTPIDKSQLRPGDLVFYSSRGLAIGHVAMYIGNGKTIHASNKRDGIKYGNLTYSKPVKYVRVLND